MTAFCTSYAYQKNRLMRRVASRVDKENIPVEKIHTAVPIAVMLKMGVKPAIYNELYEKWVERKLRGRDDYNMFIGWSGMSLRALRQAKRAGKVTVIERGSSHIQYQDQLLKEEFQKFDISFSVDPRTVDQEIREYEEADYISIPSGFVKNSFLEYGVPEEKLILNPYGTSASFKPVVSDFPKDKFRVLYMGSLMIRKGLIYLFEALAKLDIPEDRFEAWFVGKVDDEMKNLVEQHARPNWKFFGHINHYELSNYISACDVAVQPSLEEGLSMVIPQMMSCGVPVIATTNTGGEDVIEEGKSGFIVPIRSPQAIADKIQLLFEDRDRGLAMKEAASVAGQTQITWDKYGERYAHFVNSVIK